MGRRKKPGFTQMKMLSSRVESSDYDKFEYIVKTTSGKKLQEVVNLFVVNMISGSLVLSGSNFVCASVKGE